MKKKKKIVKFASWMQEQINYLCISHIKKEISLKLQGKIQKFANWSQENIKKKKQ